MVAVGIDIVPCRPTMNAIGMKKGMVKEGRPITCRESFWSAVLSKSHCASTQWLAMHSVYQHINGLRPLHCFLRTRASRPRGDVRVGLDV
eukprot:2795896-Rhodomonas_salina.3